MTSTQQSPIKDHNKIRLATDRLNTLTGEELTILKALFDRSSKKEIAYNLGVSTRTVSRRYKSILSKLRVKTLPEAISVFVQVRNYQDLEFRTNDIAADLFHDSSTAITSSTWTGKQTPKEIRQAVIHAAPMLLEGLDALIIAVEAKRINDPDAQTALDAAKELHSALDELIRYAEAGQGLSRLNEMWGSIRDKSMQLFSDHGVFATTSPILAIGTAAMLELASGENLDGSALATIWAGWLAADIAKKFGGGKTNKDI